ncbi:hypothetical protein OV079_17520 [Nannocystis pusilla]|uniref:Lipoprotein n=1 Tax=Nannocystis pusilla TaxID=889268 RepID=A0A9X3EP93_9BACT|nr:hypothetical protein [Nannocystis pusilla]MCY1007321.1 hypothetical protein [Nannocystis pusilla]
MRLRSLPLLALSLGLAACPGNESETDGTTDATTTEPTTDGPATEGTQTAGPTTTEDEPTAGTTGEPGGDLNPHTLGDHASQACKDAMTGAATFLAATADADAAAATTAYTDALKVYVQALDTANMRDDDSAITAALATGDGPGAALAEGHLYTSLMFQRGPTSRPSRPAPRTSTPPGTRPTACGTAPCAASPSGPRPRAGRAPATR